MSSSSPVSSWLQKIPGSVPLKAFGAAVLICSATAYPIFKKPAEDSRQGHDYMSSDKPESIRASQEQLRLLLLGDDSPVKEAMKDIDRFFDTPTAQKLRGLHLAQFRRLVAAQKTHELDHPHTLKGFRPTHPIPRKTWDLPDRSCATETGQIVCYRHAAGARLRHN